MGPETARDQKQREKKPTTAYRKIGQRTGRSDSRDATA